MATTSRLRPLGVGELLDAAIKVYLGNWKTLMVCVVGIVLPVEIVSVLVIFSIDADSLARNGTSSSDVEALAVVLVVEIVAFVSSLLATAACFKAISDAWLGARPAASRSLRFALRRLPRLLWLSIVLAFFLVLAFLALVIPFFWLAVCWSLAVPVALFERLGAFASIKRSYRLVKGRWWPIFGSLLVGYLMAFIIAAIVELVPSGIASAVASNSDFAAGVAAVIGRTVGAMVATPFTAAVIALLYFDMRVRKEGFDLQLLAEGMGTTRDPDAPLPAPLAPQEQSGEWWRDQVHDETTYGGFTRPAAEEPAPWRRDSSGLPVYPSADDPPAGWAPPATSAGPGDPSPPAPGESAPADDSPAGPRTAPGDSPPADDSRPADPRPAPGESPPPGAPGDSPPEPKRDPKRADWLPPEAPRGPGGL